ncbi:MAG: PAS domain S-box protein [Deltaproteobacteria bacterium]|nr:PAS domain S-box protein [Deltaproteobacteria bacterium]
MNQIDRALRRLRRSTFQLQASFAYFPWRTAGRTFFLQSAALLFGLVGIGYSVRHVALRYLARDGMTQSPSVQHFDEAIAVRLLIFLSLGLGWIAILTYTGLRPMARIMRATKRRETSRRLRPVDEDLDEDLYVDEPSEWIELEKSVYQLAENVHSREADLTREREELVTILSSVNEAIVAMGRDTEPLYFNSRFAVLFGSGNTGGGALPLRERFRVPDLLSAFERVLKEGTTRTFRVKIRTELHDAERDFSVAVSPLFSRDEERVLYGAVAVFHDITEMKATEQIRIDFVANASHELKTPLTSIKGYVETAKQDLEAGRTEDALSFLSIAERNVGRLMALVNDLLDLSQLESGAEFKKVILSTAEVTEAALRSAIDRRSKRHAIIVECKVDRVLGDARRIEQVLINLVDNATKYSPDGTEIRIVWEMGTGTNLGETVLKVKDSGPGVAEDHLPRLFERFYRVDAGRAREVGGTGLGLAIVKHIVLSHGGSIAVRSKLGEGAEFLCRFPSR